MSSNLISRLFVVDFEWCRSTEFFAEVTSLRMREYVLALFNAAQRG